MTTPAPSLEDLPPERGTILELFDTGSKDFDGLITEFQKVDDATGKYFVVSFDDKEQPMKVKRCVCRRPAIKPIKLRNVLCDLATAIRDRNSREKLELEEDVKEVLKILQKDPCCVVAHFVLGYLTLRLGQHNGSLGEHDASDQLFESVHKHHRRGLANVYAYADVVSHEYVGHEKKTFALSLLCGSTSRFVKLSVSVQREILSEEEGKNVLARLDDEAWLALSLFRLARKYHDAKQDGKKIKTLLESAGHVLNVLRVSVVKEDEAKECDVAGFSSMIERCNFVVRGSLDDLTDWIDETEGNDELLRLWDARFYIANGALDSCTPAAGGAIKFLESEQVEEFREDRKEAIQHREALIDAIA